MGPPGYALMDNDHVHGDRSAALERARSSTIPADCVISVDLFLSCSSVPTWLRSMVYNPKILRTKLLSYCLVSLPTTATLTTLFLSYSTVNNVTLLFYFNSLSIFPRWVTLGWFKAPSSHRTVR